MKATEVGVFEVKTHLSEFIEKVETGESFIITKRGKPVAELRPPQPSTGQRPTFGFLRGKVLHMADDFDSPLEDFQEYMP